MDFFDREYLISRILSGQLKWNNYIIYAPNLEVQYNSNEIFRKSLQEGRAIGLVSDDDLTDLCLERGFITEQDVIFLGFAQKELEGFQKQLYNSRKKSDDVRKIKKFINLNRVRHVKILNSINKYNSFTVEGYANYSKIDYLLRNTTFKKKNKKCSFKKNNIQSLISFYTENIILPSTIRYLSRTQPWSNMWSAFKVNGLVFPQGCEMTQQQQLLLMWSNLYDSIQEASEPPEMDVVEDDDMLDGWLLLQQEKNNKDKPQVSNNKVSQAQEQYIIANNIDEAKEIQNRNTPEMRKVQKQREKCILDRGEVLESQLPDVQRKLLIERNRRST